MKVRFIRPHVRHHPNFDRTKKPCKVNNPNIQHLPIGTELDRPDAYEHVLWIPQMAIPIDDECIAKVKELAPDRWEKLLVDPNAPVAETLVLPPPSAASTTVGSGDAAGAVSSPGNTVAAGGESSSGTAIPARTARIPDPATSAETAPTETVPAESIPQSIPAETAPAEPAK